MRLFKVSNSDGQHVLVEATSDKAAIAYVASKRYTATAVPSKDILSLVRSGATIEEAPARMRKAKAA